VSGIPTRPAYFRFVIRATATRGQETLTFDSSGTGLDVKDPLLVSYGQAYPRWGESFSHLPLLSSYLTPWAGATYQFALVAWGNMPGTLPTGLSLDPATGQIQGVAQQQMIEATFTGIKVTVTRNGVTYEKFTSVRIYVQG
jgi:hypothetical protein